MVNTIVVDSEKKLTGSSSGNRFQSYHNHDCSSGFPAWAGAINLRCMHVLMLKGAHLAVSAAAGVGVVFRHSEIYDPNEARKCVL